MKRAVVAFTLVLIGGTASAGPSAEQLYDEGQRAYDTGHYAVAIERWQASYEVSKLPLLILNIAQAYRLAGDCANALATYRRYVELEPTSEQSGLASGFIGELEPRCGAPMEPPRANYARENPGRALRLAGVVTGAAGALSVVIGIGIGHHASTLANDVSSACAVDCDWSSQEARDSAGRRDATIGYTLDIVGVAAIVGGSVMYHLGTRGGALSVSPRSTEGGVSVSWSGAW